MTNNFDFLNNSSSFSGKQIWIFDKIYEANILQVKDKISKDDFLSLKGSKDTLKGKTRNFLRKKLQSIFSSFLENNTDKNVKLQNAIQCKMIIENFAPSLAKDYQKALDFVKANDKNK